MILSIMFPATILTDLNLPYHLDLLVQRTFFAVGAAAARAAARAASMASVRNDALHKRT